MISLKKNGGGFSWNALALALGTGALSAPAAKAQTPADCPTCAAVVAAPAPIQQPKKSFVDSHQHPDKTRSALGYGPPGVYTGFQGFGLGYHLGYGYGSDALGVGADGGYPNYGGPGYPHCEPVLRRLRPIAPFAYFGGPGGPDPANPNFYGGIGQLVPDPPVITIGDDRYDTGYGTQTGAVPYPESFLAPFTTRAAAGGSASGVSSDYPVAPSTNSAPSPNSDHSAIDPALGVVIEPIVDAEGVRRLRISRVDAGSAAAKAGLHVGDVIQSVNGYLTEVPGNLSWIIAQKSPGNVLKINVRAASDGKVASVTAQLP